MKKNLFWKLAGATVFALAVTGAGAAPAGANPCEGKGGAIFAQASGEGDELSVEVACADGSWELY